MHQSISGGGGLVHLARVGALTNPGGTPEKFGDVNFNMDFNLKSHNFKANSVSVYKLLRFATGCI